MAEIINKTKDITYDANDNEIVNYYKTSADQVIADDGSTLQEKVGDINGITDSLTSDASNIAASANGLKTVNDKLIDNSKTFKFGYDSVTGRYGYYKDGADTVTPFSGKTVFKYVKKGDSYSGFILDVRDKSKLTLNVSQMSTSLKASRVSSMDDAHIEGNTDYGSLIQNITSVGIDVIIDVLSYDYISLRFYKSAESTNKYYSASGKVTITIE